MSPCLRPRAARPSLATMSDESLRYFEAFPSWLRSLPDDAVALAGVLTAESTPEPVRRALGGGLT
ncbi:MAG: hypothetical protein NVS3B10_20860 [Polyangiales bacterium]